MNFERLTTAFLVNLKLCLLELYTNRVRSFITSLGIFLGVASLLVNLSFVRGMDDDLKASMERIGGLNIIKVHAVEPVSEEEKIIFQNSPGLSLAEAERIAEEGPHIKAVIKGREVGWHGVTAVGKRTHGKVIAVSQEYFEVFNYRIVQGRSFTDEEMAKRRYVCLVGPRIVSRLFGAKENPLGKIVRIRNIPIEIIGVIGVDSPGNVRSMEVLFPFSVYAGRFKNAVRNLDEIIFQLDNSSNVKNTVGELKRKYQALHRGVDDFEIETSSDKIKEMQIASTGMKILLWAIAVISLVVGGVSIMNIMFATIGDRVREIGIRKTIGAQRFDIFAQFMIEAVTLCFVGAGPGIILGTLVTLAPAGVFPFMPRLSVTDYSISIIFTIGAGLLSGLFPALKAANMQPVEALRF